jgi:DNA polymerase
MIIGEAPGKDEDVKGKPFTGPAGIKLDQIFAGVGWDTNKDWYLTNVVKCRPRSDDGIRQNFTPSADHRAACRPYILQEISYLKPHTIVLLGKSAVSSVLPKLSGEAMGNIAGKLYHDEVWPSITFFVMYHPAALLHLENHSPEGHQQLRQLMWKHINTLREFVLDLEQ